MSELAFSGAICRDDTREVHRPSGRDVNLMSSVQGKSPLVKVKAAPCGNLDMVSFHPAARSVQSTLADYTRRRLSDSI